VIEEFFMATTRLLAIASLAMNSEVNGSIALKKPL
jgi:hypothetical protein